MSTRKTLMEAAKLSGIKVSECKYEVIVGNLGMVYSGNDKAEAESVFAEYAGQSNTN